MSEIQICEPLNLGRRLGVDCEAVLCGLDVGRESDGDNGRTLGENGAKSRVLF